MKKIILLIYGFCFPISCFSQENFSCKYLKQNVQHAKATPSLLADSLRSDTVNILKYTINLRITDFTLPDTIWGNTQVRFTPKMNGINTLSLDLLKMTIDSITMNSSPLTWSYNDTLLIVNLPFVHNISDTSVVAVYYHGDPVMDASGWGGWYNQSGYAFNLGVGFAAIPHNYGRVWFPCFDNFVERSKYEFSITTNGGKTAYCNGALVKDTTDANGFSTRTWVLNEEIPSYLACVAIANYTQVNWTFSGMTGQVPVVLAALPADTVNMKNSFVNLPAAFAAFENRYGPYRWNKVGYSLVPFSSGAMEHATNVTYPKLAANGTLTYQNIMAHEFSHQWWGNLVTCHDAEEMWINEGMAVFSEFIFEEWLNGTTTYKNLVRANHEEVIHYTHIKEGGFLPLCCIPQNLTYGDHSYLHGANVAHTLRGYLGDSLFFLGLKSVLANNQFTDLTSEEFRDEMTAATGVNMNDFFAGWIFQGGFPHFSIDSFKTVPNGPNYDVTLYIKQKLDGAPNYFNSVPLEIAFKDAQWNEAVKTVYASGQNTTATVTISFNPVFAGIDLNEKISDAVTSDMQVIKNAGTFFSSNSNGRMQITVQAIPPNDSAFILVEHNWAFPDSFKTLNPNYKLSSSRWWKVSGIFPPLFDATSIITYDGRTIISGGGGYLDNDLITANNQEDSIALLYRKDASDDWKWFPYYTKTMGNLTDKYGTIKIDSLLPGEYTIAFLKNGNMGISETGNTPSIAVFPNPSSGIFELRITDCQNCRLEIYNIYGKKVLQSEIRNLPAGQAGPESEIFKFDLPDGMYFLQVKSQNHTAVKKIIISR